MGSPGSSPPDAPPRFEVGRAEDWMISSVASVHHDLAKFPEVRRRLHRLGEEVGRILQIGGNVGYLELELFDHVAHEEVASFDESTCFMRS